jgi:histone acetyltransferase (RNA polymerase elongator complex component)
MGCPHQCSFCNQKTISGAVSELTVDEVNCVLSQAVVDGVNPQNTEIAFFGGSFTAIDRAYMVSLLEATRPFIQKGLFSGIRVSTRPDAINSEVLDILRSYGVTAIELGAQSTDDEVLLLNRRGHTFCHIKEASQLIKAYGFSLGLQMMTGLLGDTNEKSLKTCEDIISLKPDTVRIYPTIVLEGTCLGEMFKKGEYKPQSVEAAASLCAQLLERFYENNIKVIRLGLHSGGNVEEGYLAGPYHPAFGELCESKIYLKKAIDALSYTDKSVEHTVFVHPSEISKMVGQKKSNIIHLNSMGYKVSVKGKVGLEKYVIEIL